MVFSYWTLTIPKSLTSDKVILCSLWSEIVSSHLSTDQKAPYRPLVVNMHDCCCFTAFHFSYPLDENWYPTAELLPLSDSAQSRRNPCSPEPSLLITYMCSILHTFLWEAPRLHGGLSGCNKHQKKIILTTVVSSWSLTDDINKWWAPTYAC